MEGTEETNAQAEPSSSSYGTGGTIRLPAISDLPVQEHVFTESQLEEYREQDQYLPIANVARIMRNALPPSAKIAKESKECLQECVSEFISFITSEASEKCRLEKRKTVTGEDILWAMNTLGFENYSTALTVWLTRYRTIGGNGQGPKPSKAKKAKIAKTEVFEEPEEREEEEEEDEE